MFRLAPCSSCRRHVRSDALGCPFCARVGLAFGVAVALLATPAVVHADAATSDAGTDADAATDAQEAVLSPDRDYDRQVAPLYGVPPDRSRGCSGCTVGGATAADGAATAAAAFALAWRRRRRRE